MQNLIEFLEKAEFQSVEWELENIPSPGIIMLMSVTFPPSAN